MLQVFNKRFYLKPGKWGWLLLDFFNELLQVYKQLIRMIIHTSAPHSDSHGKNYVRS